MCRALKPGAHVLPPGAGCCGAYPEMTKEDIERAAEEGEAARAYRASKSGGGDKSAAATPTAAAAAGWAPGSKYTVRDGDAGSGISGSSGRGAYLWSVVRAAQKSGKLAELAVDANFNIVAHVFHKLFPRDFDRVGAGAGGDESKEAGWSRVMWATAGRGRGLIENMSHLFLLRL